MVPINGSETMLDLMAHLGAPVVVASRTALGTINHTVLTVRALRGAGVCVKGVVMIGEENGDNERADRAIRRRADRRAHPDAELYLLQDAGGRIRDRI